jgi:hypothetical protein
MHSSARPCTPRPLRAHDVPGTQFPARLHRGKIQSLELGPALIDLQRGTRQRRELHGIRLLDVEDLLLNETVPVKGHDDRRVRARNRGDGDGKQWPVVRGHLIANTVEKIHSTTSITLAGRI